MVFTLLVTLHKDSHTHEEAHTHIQTHGDRDTDKYSRNISRLHAEDAEQFSRAAHGLHDVASAQEYLHMAERQGERELGKVREGVE